MPEQPWEWGNNITVYAPSQQSLLLILSFIASNCLSSTVLKTDQRGRNRDIDTGWNSITRSGEGVWRVGELNWKRWPCVALEDRVASSEHSNLQCTIWTLRPWAARFSTGPGTGRKVTECSICTQPSTHRRGEAGTGVTWLLGQYHNKLLLESTTWEGQQENVVALATADHSKLHTYLNF